MLTPGCTTRHVRGLRLDEALSRCVALCPLPSWLLLMMYEVIPFLLLHVEAEGMLLWGALGYGRPASSPAYAFCEHALLAGCGLCNALNPSTLRRRHCLAHLLREREALRGVAGGPFSLLMAIPRPSCLLATRQAVARQPARRFAPDSKHLPRRVFWETRPRIMHCLRWNASLRCFVKVCAGGRRSGGLPDFNRGGHALLQVIGRDHTQRAPGVLDQVPLVGKLVDDVELLALADRQLVVLQVSRWTMRATTARARHSSGPPCSTAKTHRHRFKKRTGAHACHLASVVLVHHHGDVLTLEPAAPQRRHPCVSTVSRRGDGKHAAGARGTCA